MKICIYGAGAIGGYMGVMLSEGEADVSLIARGAHLAAIQENGLKVVFKDGSQKQQKMPATDNPADLGPQDIVIVALKAHQAWEVADEMKPLLGPQTVVVTAQNGLPWWYFYGFKGQYEDLRIESVDPDDRQWNAIGPERVIGCTVYPAAEIIEPGVIKHIYGDRFGIGEPTRWETERIKDLGNAMEAGGLKPRLSSSFGRGSSFGRLLLGFKNQQLRGVVDATGSTHPNLNGRGAIFSLANTR